MESMQASAMTMDNLNSQSTGLESVRYDLPRSRSAQIQSALIYHPTDSDHRGLYGGHM